MITRFDIEQICNYTENSKPTSNVGSINYLESVVSNSEKYQLELKRKNRNLAIDAIVDNKDEEYKNREKAKWPPEDSDEMSEISMVVKTLSIKASTFIDLDNLFSEVMNKLESLTSSPMTIIPNIAQVNIVTNLRTDKENFDATSRKICSRVQMLSHMISSKSYLGIGTTIICGYDVIGYITESPTFMPSSNQESMGVINGMNVFQSNIIKSNKIIVIRASKTSNAGINVINNISSGTYFMSETPGSWDKCVMWFEVI